MFPQVVIFLILSVFVSMNLLMAAVAEKEKVNIKQEG